MMADNSLLRFNYTYFCCAALLFLIEVLIAAYAHDNWIRPYGGDVLVVIFIYCAIKSFISTGVAATAISVLVFAYLIEVLQYFHFINMLGLQHSAAAKLILGTSFSWIDMVCYTIGIFLILNTEYLTLKYRVNKTRV